MPKLTSSQAADKQIKNLSGSVEQIRIGVDRVTESPMEKAAANVDGYLAGVQRAVTNGKFQAGLRRVSLEEWKEKFKTKGIPRIASGAQASRGKLVKFYDEFFPFLDSAQREVNAMPKVTLEDSIARASAMIRKVATFKRAG